MSSFFLAPCLGDSSNGRNPCFGSAGLFGEVNKKWSSRDHASDGWIGDTSHQARPSDHNPDWDDNGIVRAIDIDNNTSEEVRRAILNATIGDPRVWYVISNGIIYSRTHGWAALTYTGSNSHHQHVHVSLLAHVGEFNLATWFEAELPKIKAVPVSLSKVREQFLAAAQGEEVEFRNGVGRIQRVLNRQHGASLTVDGLVGKATLDAWAKFERSLPNKDNLGQARIPDRLSLAAMAKGRFRVVE